MLLLTRGCTFIKRTIAAVTALDKSFILPTAKTKARKSCHCEVLNALKESDGKDFANAQLSSSFCVPPSLSGSCHSLHTMDQDYYDGTAYLSPGAGDAERADEFEYEV